MSYILKQPLVIGVLILWSLAATAAASDCPPDNSALFARLAGAFRFVTTTGHTIQLANLHTDANIREHFPWLEDRIATRQTELLGAAPLQIYPLEDKADGICHAQVINAAGIWVQEELAREGLAPLTHLPHSDEVFSFLMAAERQARRTKAGIWQQPEAFVHTSESINRFELENSYQYAEGRIGYVHDFNRIILVCLDKDPWKSWCSWFLRDAYIRIRDEQGIDMLDKKSVIGRRILMRGDLINRDGLRAFMPLPELIEFLTADEALY